MSLWPKIKAETSFVKKVAWADYFLFWSAADGAQCQLIELAQLQLTELSQLMELKVN